MGLSLSLSRYLSGGVRSCVELSVVNGKEGSQCCPGATGTVQSVYVTLMAIGDDGHRDILATAYSICHGHGHGRMDMG